MKISFLKPSSRQKSCIMALSLCFLLVGHVRAEHVHERPDSHAPIGVMGDHVMGRDEWMLSYRYMDMEMEGNRIGTNRVSTPLPGFMVSPLSMDMRMHMLGVMTGLSDDLTVSLMVPVLDISMDHRINMNGMAFTTEADGLGDISVAGIYRVNQIKGGDLLLNFSLSLPTGSIDEKDAIPVSKGVPVQLPYPMQTGSGTYDLTPGITYTKMLSNWSWGVQGLYTIRTGSNDNGYTLGNKLNMNVWMAHVLSHAFSISFRLNALDWGNIDGADNKLAAKPTVPTKNPELRGGSRVDALLGINYVAASLNHMHFALELGRPVYQDLNGPQLETDLVLTLGAQYSF